MEYERQVKEPDAQWQMVTKDDVKRALSGGWRNWEELLADGETLWNPFARYRAVRRDESYQTMAEQLGI